MVVNIDDPLVGEIRASRRLPPPPVCAALRRGAGVSQQRAAEWVGVERMTISRWERGIRDPQGQLRLRYIAFLDTLEEAIR